MLEMVPDALRVLVFGEVLNEPGVNGLRGEVERLDGEVGPPYDETAIPRGLTGMGMLSLSSATLELQDSLSSWFRGRDRRSSAWDVLT
jgi:hypothetical protein